MPKATSHKNPEPGFESLESAFKDRNVSLLAVKDLDYYFDSYSQVGIHYDMLTDKTRTLCYKNSITKNPQLFKDKIVMDIGCGTGILSMFAASAGAKKVIAIEMASIMAMAKRIVQENGLQDRIEFCRGKIEEIVLPVEKVDIIVSEWMGYLLLFEGMFDSVIHARDKYLAEGGMLFPNREIIYVAGFENFRFGDQMYDYHCYKGVNYQEFVDPLYMMPDVNLVDPQTIITDEVNVIEFDLEKVSVADLDFQRQFTLTAKSHGYIHGIALWFDSLFTHGYDVINLSTSPHSTPTHWKQGLMFLKQPVPVRKGDAVNVTLTLKKHVNNPRSLDLRLDYSLKTQAVDINETQYYLFK